MTYQKPGKKVVQRADGRKFLFHDRHLMKKGHPTKRMRALPPLGTLPVNWYGSLQFPIYDNDMYGICMLAGAGHGQGTFTGNASTEVLFSDPAFLNQYLTASGGDNGLDEGTLIGLWKSGIAGAPAGSVPQVILDALDVDPTDPALMQGAIQWFGGVLFMLDVPDAWINAFTGSGSDVWDAGPGVAADQNNGHGTWINGEDSTSRDHLQTWGSSVWLTQAGIAICDPSAFTALSPNWFNSQGYAPNGQHATQVAAAWVAAGGSQTAAATLVSMFPAPGPTPNPPPPGPAPGPTPTPAGMTTVTLTDPAGSPVTGTFSYPAASTPVPAGGAVLQPATVTALLADLNAAPANQAITPLVLTVLKLLCPFAPSVPAPFGAILAELCAELPAAEDRPWKPSAKFSAAIKKLPSCGGCK